MSEVVNEENRGRQPITKAKKDSSRDIFSAMEPRVVKVLIRNSGKS